MALGKRLVCNAWAWAFLSQCALCVEYMNEFSLGIGGFYNNTSVSNAVIHNGGAYISANIGKIEFYRNDTYAVYMGMPMQLGYGGNSMQGLGFESIYSANQMLFVSLLPKITLATHITNFTFIFGGEAFIFSLEKGVGVILPMLGIEISDSIPFAKNLAFSYSVSYFAIPNVGHTREKGRGYATSRAKGYSQSVEISLGLEQKIKDTALYYKGIIKYYNIAESNFKQGLNPTITMPSMNMWHIGIESGIVF